MYFNDCFVFSERNGVFSDKEHYFVLQGGQQRRSDKRGAAIHTGADNLNDNHKLQQTDNSPQDEGDDPQERDQPNKDGLQSAIQGIPL